jgi:hypothetical protein
MSFSNGKRFISYPQEHAVNAFLLCPLCKGSIFVGVTMLDGSSNNGNEGPAPAPCSTKRCKLDDSSEVDSSADTSDSDATREESGLILSPPAVVVASRVSLLSPPTNQHQEEGDEEEESVVEKEAK